VYSTFIGLSKQKGAMVNGWFNGASFIARILSGILADLFATDVILLICIWTNAVSVLVLWVLSKSFPVYMLFAVVYGISFSGTITLTPAMVAEHYGKLTGER
jgi:MFS family permease